MRLRFWQKKATAQEVSDLECSVVEALQAIMEPLGVIASAIEGFEFPSRADGEVEENVRIDRLETQVHDLVLAVSEGIQRVQRSENRIRHIIQGAKRDLAEAGFEHAGVEAEAGELSEVDGGPGEEEQVPAVHKDVGQAQHSVIPGVTVRQMQIARARRR